MSYLDSTLKKLSILSRNKCAFPKCPLSLIDDNGILTGEICHIKARNAGGLRYDPSQTNKERDAFENLILMCPYHHTVIDSSEEIFTVEVLQKIKRDHESKDSEPSQQEKLEILIEKLHSLIEKDNGLLTDSAKLLKDKNSSLARAKSLAAKKIHDERRQKWQYSDDGLRDTINSINEIYSLIHQRLSEEAETFETLGIKLNAENMYIRCIYNNNFGSQLEVKGIEGNYDRNFPANIQLRLWLFSKRPAHQHGLFYSDKIKGFEFQPDLLPDGQVVWNELNIKSSGLSAEGICEKMFDLLINEIEKKKSSNNQEDWS